MIHKIYKIIFTILFLAVNNNSQSQTYCQPVHQAECIFSFINNISVSNLNQAATGCTGDLADYTNITVYFSPATLYSFSITTSYLGNDNFGWWIDYNDDGDFADADEFLGNFTASSNTLTGSISIAADAPSGKHRMRVRGGYNLIFTQADECTRVVYGETHDYTAQIAITCREPSIQSTVNSPQSTTNTSTTLNWNRGDGDGGVIAIARTASTTAFAPMNGMTYNAKTAFRTGSTTGNGNYVIYNGTGNSVTVTGLSSGSAYSFDIYEYNISGPCYMTPASNITVSTTGPPPCSDAAITNLPFSATRVSNCTGIVRNNACGSSATEQAYIYKFVAPDSNCYAVTLSNIENFWNPTYLDISTACRGNGECIAGISGKNSLYLTFTTKPGQEYLLSISGGGSMGGFCGTHDIIFNLCPKGMSCSDPELISSLPFIKSNESNCIGDNMPASLCNPHTGLDKIYKYSPSVSQCISFNLTGFGTINLYDGSYLGSTTLYEGCPNAGGTCIKTANSSMGAYLEGGKDYFLITSYGADIMEYCDKSYSISVQNPPEGGSCCNPLLLTIPTTGQISGSTCGKGNFFNKNDANGNPFIQGEDVVYQFTAPDSACYFLTLEVTGPYTQFGQINNDKPGMFLYKGCPTFRGTLLASGISSDANYRKTFMNYQMKQGDTYYLIISSMGTNINSSFNTGCIDFNLRINTDNLLCNLNIADSLKKASDLCENAPLIDFCKGYSGSNDPINYTKTNIGGNLNSVLQGAGMAVGRNSWLKFKADSTDIELFYWVSNCSPNKEGMQFALLSSSDCNNYSALAILPAAPEGSGYIHFNGLTKNNEYYIMLDHNGTDSDPRCDCDYKIYPHYGFICDSLCPKAAVSYTGSPFCNDTSPQNVNIIGSAEGTFSSSPPGLNINPATGTIAPSESMPGSYIVTYSIAATNTCPAFSTSTNVTINTAPSLNSKFIKQLKYPGDSISFSVSPSGKGPFYFQWIKNGNNIAGKTNSVFNLNSVACGDSGIYACKISNKCANITAKIAYLYILNCSRFRFAISGYVKYENADSFPMSSMTDNTVTNVFLLNNGDTLIEKTETDDYGFYVFPYNINGNYKLVASSLKKWGGSNPVDALLVCKNYIGLNIIPGIPSLKKIAADVNNDFKINPVDALLINRRYIGVINHFSDKNNVSIPDWIFNNPSIKIETADINKNIIVICAGDVNGSYSNIPAKTIYNSINSNHASCTVNSAYFDLPVYLDDITGLGAIGLKLQVSGSMFQVVDVKSEIDGLIFRIINNEQLSSINYQLINIAWSAENEGCKLTPGKPLFYISCKSKSQYPIPNTQYSILMSSESVIADIDANIISTDKLVIPKLAYNYHLSAINETFNAYSYNNLLHVYYSNPENKQAVLSIYNALGQQLKTFRILNSEFSINLNISPGAYIVRLLTNNNVFVKKIFIK